MSVLAASQAFSDTAGILATFLRIGVLVNGLLVYIAVLVIGERRANRDAAERRPGATATRDEVEPV